MAENVVYLHREPDPIGHFLRVGSTGHRQLEDLLGSGRMLLNRIVIDASSVARQHDLLVSQQRAAGTHARRSGTFKGSNGKRTAIPGAEASRRFIAGHSLSQAVTV